MTGSLKADEPIIYDFEFQPDRGTERIQEHKLANEDEMKREQSIRNCDEVAYVD